MKTWVYFLSFLSHNLFVRFLRILLLEVLVLLVMLHVVTLVVGYGWNCNVLVLHRDACSCHLIHFVHVFLFLIIWQCVIFLSSNSSIILTWIHRISNLPIFITNLRINRMRLMKLLRIIPGSLLLHFINLLIVLLSHF